MVVVGRGRGLRACWSLGSPETLTLQVSSRREDGPRSGLWHFRPWTFRTESRNGSPGIAWKLDRNAGLQTHQEQEPQRFLCVLNNGGAALAGWLRWLEHLPMHQKVAGLIPRQGMYLGCGFDPWSKRIQEATNRCLSLTSMFLSLPSSLSKNQRTHPEVRI